MQTDPSQANKDIVVYTAIFHQYDVLLPPKIQEDDIDYICFTDDPTIVPEPWRPRVINSHNESSILQTRRLKILPHRHFPEYDYSVWVDGNIHITGQIVEFICQNMDDTNMITPSHPQRNCTYNEARICVEEGKSNPEKTKKQMDKYQEIGFPSNQGLSWNCVLFREHNEENVIQAMELWWEEFQNETDRDQLSFEFAAWKTGLKHRRADIDVGSSGGLFSRHNHRPPGIIGDLWEVIIRAEENRSGFIADIYYLLASVLYYLHRTREIYTEEGLFSLYREIKSFSLRKLR